MARIAFFTETLPPTDDLIASFSYALIESLADQQHEIKVFSTYQPETPLPPRHQHIEIVRPFRKWSWLEVPKVLPILMSFQPDVLHFIQPHRESLRGFSNAMNFITAASPITGGSATIASFFDLQNDDLSSHRHLLNFCDAVTVCSHSQHTTVKRYLKNHNRTIIEMIPLSHCEPGASDETEQAKASDPAKPRVTDMLRNGKRFIFLPAPLDAHSDIDASFALIARILEEQEDVWFVFGGGWNSIPAWKRQTCLRELHKSGADRRVLITGALDAKVQRELTAQAHAVLLTPLRSNSLFFLHAVREALRLQTPIIMSANQVRLDSLPWENRRHALIVGPSEESQRLAIRAILNDPALHVTLKAHMQEFVRREVIDGPGNILSRLYTKAIASKQQH